MNKKILVFSGIALFCVSLYAAEDVKVKLNSADGSTSFQVRNSNDAVVSTITSTGDAIFVGDLRVQGNDMFFGASQTERKIYDDPVNYVIGLSTNFYVAGRLHAAGSFRLGLSAVAGYVLTTDASGVGTWQAAPGAGGGISGSGTAGTMPRFTGSAALGDSSLDDDGTNATATGRLTVSGAPAGTGAGQGPLYINPSSASSDQTLLGVAVGGAERLRFSKEGNLFLYSQVFPGSTAGGTQTARYLADDPSNYVLKISTNLYVDGRVHAGSSFRLGTSATAGYVLTADAGGVGTWQAPSGGGGITLPIDSKGDGNVITSTGDVSVQIDTDNNESKAFVVRASTGNAIFAAIERAGVPGAGEIHLSNYNRRIYDDPANNVLGFSSDIYVNGRVHAGSSFRLGTSTTAGYVLTADAGGVGTWQAAPGGWTDGGSVVYPTSASDDAAIGGTTSAAPFYFDVSLSSLAVTGLTVTNKAAFKDVTISGSNRMGNLSSDPSGALGMIYYNTGTKRLRLYGDSGWVDVATGTITGSGGGGSITDRSVLSRNLLVTSTAVYTTADIGTYATNTWTDIPLMYSILSVDAQPSMIFVNFSCSNYHDWNNNSTFFRILIDGTEVASTEAKRYNAADGNLEVFPIALAGGLRVTSTGSKEIKVQVKSATDSTHFGHVFNKSMIAFTTGCQ